jgi:tRNA modification GTPase
MEKSFGYLSDTEDTITAISTPFGESGIGIVRISGKKAISIADKIFKGEISPRQAESHKANYGKIISPDSTQEIDEVYLTVFNSPKSYTKEDLVEISCHGSPYVLYRVLEETIKAGARLANPGEFTLRAFLNGRIDLAQAEAVAEIIKAKTDLSLSHSLKHLQGELSEKLNLIREELISILADLEARIDFPDEEIEELDRTTVLEKMEEIESGMKNLIETYEEGKILREGLRVVIVGKTNVGKSSLLNAFLKEERAIVTPIPGTTRDVISEYTNFKGLPVRLTDTAGFRVSKDKIEIEGIKKTKIEINKADFILFVVDAATGITKEDKDLEKELSEFSYLIAINKVDLVPDEKVKEIEKKLSEGLEQKEISQKIHTISALKSWGIEELKDKIAEEVFFSKKGLDQEVIITNLRHKEALTKAVQSLFWAKNSLLKNMSFEFVALDLRVALDSIGEIVGKVVTEDILNKIFSEFCIGK